MSDVLSAQETAALLDGIEDGSVQTDAGGGYDGEARLWNFTEQDAIVRGKYPALERANERFARELCSTLPTLIKQITDVRYIGLRKEKHADYLNALPGPCALSLMQVRPLNGPAMLVMDTHLVFMTVDSYFAGPCRPAQANEERSLTATETRVIELLREPIVANLSEVWETIRPLEFQLTEFETNPAFVELSPPTQEMLISRFEVNFDENVGELHLVLPLSTIEPIVRVLDGRAHLDVQAERAQFQARLAQALLAVSLPVSADLARLSMNLREVLNFGPGDVIPFEMHQHLTVESGGAALLQARFGTSRHRNAVLVTGAIPEGEK